ncbi:uncharacterized protein RCC_01917 [Ramularia collo-cygni]|uniref:Efflux pump antibiotic resistance protein n=1 Tax=Ramularia collo-cygni TaxID=112498 RepID=A0A2D3UVF2_9PEZI|nr:uncharacterized protein RCC_01917 [Ramularia collo-cygni]CZT16077.1 uncharacterized protein RCC_01917 [Ramularia collo-cygni]
MSVKEFFFGFSDDTKAQFPWLFVDYDIDRHTCRRTVPMQVLSLGMSRTGTASMKKALEILGYPTCHGFDMHANVKDGDMWGEAFAAKYFGDTSTVLDRNFWDKMLGHVSATTDTPANCFGPELIASYPEAKVILVERDVDAWYTSFDQAVIVSNEIPHWFRALLEQLSEKAWKLRHIIPGIMKGQFQARDIPEWRSKAKTVYKEHYAEIRGLLEDQPDRLLEYQLGNGWKPLCEFLGKDIPDVEFPRINESAQHDTMIKIVFLQMARNVFIASVKTALPVVVAFFLWRDWS